MEDQCREFTCRCLVQLTVTGKKTAQGGRGRWPRYAFVFLTFSSLLEVTDSLALLQQYLLLHNKLNVRS